MYFYIYYDYDICIIICFIIFFIICTFEKKEHASESVTSPSVTTVPPNEAI